MSNSELKEKINNSVEEINKLLIEADKSNIQARIESDIIYLNRDTKQERRVRGLEINLFQKI